MQLQCTLVRAPGAVSAGSGPPAGPVELTVAAPDGCPGAALEAEVRRSFGTGGLTVAGLQLRGLTLGRPPLVNGAVLVDGHAGSSGFVHGAAGELPSAVLLAVESGPAAGTVLPLRRGSYRIGRTNADLTIPDADLSREHAGIEVSDTALTLVDLGSINGTEVDGKRVSKTPVAIGSRIRCGNSSMSVMLAAPAEAGDADLGFAGRSVAEPLIVQRQAAPAGRAVLVLGAILPVIMGVWLALATRSWMFLAFTAVSAVTLLVPVASGSRQRRELRSAVAAAAEQDLDRRRRSAPSAAVLALGAAFPGRSPAGTGRSPAATGSAAEEETSTSTEISGPKPGPGVWLRLGLADQPANIRIEPDLPGFRPPRLGAVPLLLDPGHAVVSVRGPEAEVQGLVRSFLMQLTGYPLARGTRIAIHGPASALPLAARFLPGVSLHSRVPDIMAALTDTSGETGLPRVLLLFGGTASDGTGLAGPADGIRGAGIIATARRLGWRVVHLPGAEQQPAETDIELGERGAVLRTGNACHRFVADLVPARVFDRYCRACGQSIPGAPAGGQSVPARCGLRGLLDQTAAATAKRWAAGRLEPGLTVPLGRTARGVRVLDLEADGPHVLVAGTTGSGKSELLRTITAGLALSYPPDRVNVIFFDFKGGSGLSPLVSIPHCVGMLTDLASSQLGRTIVSLRAEVRRREQLLAAAHAPDLAAYRLSPSGGPPLPQLVLVIDEFRMLVEEAPQTLTELMRIAAIGRSLGIHLIMATQRPQGALTADIRANVTTSIALRVQSAHESADVIGTSAAAAIPVNRPGRAYLAKGGEPAEEFQSASLGSADDEVSASCRVRVLEARAALAMQPSLRGCSPPPETPSDAAVPVVELTASLWAGIGGSPVHRPVAPPLPDVLAGPADVAALTAERPVAGTAGDWAVGLGLLDLPEEQRLAALTWRPGAEGHLAVIGAGSRDAAHAMSAATQQLLSHPTECHFYVLDADGSLTGLAGAHRTGSFVSLHDVRRGVRLLERLAVEMSQRLSRLPAASGPPLVLVISGWGSWLSALRAGPLTRAEDHLQDIVRDGRPAGITVVISGDRELVTSRFFPAIPNRLYCPRGASAESRLVWPSMPEVPSVPGRAVASGALSAGRQAACQLYAPGRGFAGSGKGTVLSDAMQGPVRVKPFRMDPLPVRLAVADVLSRLHGTEGATQPGRPAARRLVVGMGGDEPAPADVRLPQGAVLAVLGSAGSGKSSFLASLPALNPSVPGWLRPGPAPSPGDFWTNIHRDAVEGRLPRDAILLVDDADMLPAASQQHLMDLNSRGWAVVFSAAFSQSLMQRLPLALAARASGRGILIAPRSPLDGDIFGLRIEPDSHPPPGRALLLADGAAMPVQLAAADDVRGP
ncbi:FtsK/SpoIIIE domain-containing protein [Arthrobacter globiformis]|uniref:FtsK/SpoIIIE domain-containing protein n=1 Tax=Arthrobacter globiformis TaxID=1665 RepID=UPI00397C2906